MKAFHLLLLFVLWINASYSQGTNVKKEKIDSMVRVINSMKLRADSMSTISSDSMVADHIICYYNNQKAIYRIEGKTTATSVDSKQRRNVVTVHNVYYYQNGLVIKIDSKWFFNGSPTDTGYIYFDKGHFIYSTKVNDTPNFNDMLGVQAMKYYQTFIKRI